MQSLTAASRFRGLALLASILMVSAHKSAQPVAAAREQFFDSLLQARLQSYQAQRAVGKQRNILGRGSQDSSSDNEDAVNTRVDPAAKSPAEKPVAKSPANKTAAEKSSAADATAPDSKVPSVIPASFWKTATKELDQAGLSTPEPAAASINAPPATPTPQPWQKVMSEAEQPLDTKIGSAMMYEMTGSVTPTPPPAQDAISSEFMAKCPIVLFGKDLSVRAGSPSCNETLGRWVDPSPSNVRSVLRWYPTHGGGLVFGVDSSLSGKGSVHFAEINEQLTLSGYKFVMKNCLGIERWHLEESVYRVDSMGKVSSTMELHDIRLNSEAFFIKYLIRSAAGEIKAESGLFRMDQNNFTFTEWKDGMNTGKVLAVVTRQGNWKKKGWSQCMAASSPRGWSLLFPESGKERDSATVQDIRVAIAGTVTLMGYRDETRTADGLSSDGDTALDWMTMECFVLAFVLCILLTNFCMVFRASGLRDKVKRILFDSEGAIFPKQPHAQRTPPLHTTY